jgi:MFS family permease
MAMPLAHLVSHVGDIYGVPARGAEMLSLTLFAGFVSRALLLGRMTERFGGLRSLFIFSMGQIIGLLLIADVSDLAALYVISIIFGLGYGGVLPCYPVIVREYLPAHQAGRRSATVIVFGAIGMALGGWLAGYIFDVTGGYAVAFLVGAGANFLNLAIIAIMIRQKMLGRLTPVPA